MESQQCICGQSKHSFGCPAYGRPTHPKPPPTPAPPPKRAPDQPSMQVGRGPFVNGEPLGESAKPGNCTCQYPVVTLRNMGGHAHTCPVYVDWRKRLDASNPRSEPTQSAPDTNITVAITEQIGAVSVTFMAASIEQLAELMESERIRKSMESGGES